MNARRALAPLVAALSLGDRFLMMWGDDAQTAPGTYELYYQILSPSLAPVTERKRFTFYNSTSLAPALAPGPGGKIGVMFDSWKDGTRQVYFSTLECQPD